MPKELLDQAEEWDELHRWERSELGKALRRLGLTYTEIREIIPVPKSTLSDWCRDVYLISSQIEAIQRRTSSQAGVPRDTQRKRRLEIQLLRDRARSTAMSHVADPLFVAGVSLYWAEGSKTRNDLAISNTDPALLRVFVDWVRTFLDPRRNFASASTCTGATVNARP